MWCFNISTQCTVGIFSKQTFSALDSVLTTELVSRLILHKNISDMSLPIIYFLSKWQNEFWIMLFAMLLQWWIFLLLFNATLWHLTQTFLHITQKKCFEKIALFTDGKRLRAHTHDPVHLASCFHHSLPSSCWHRPVSVWTTSCHFMWTNSWLSQLQYRWLNSVQGIFQISAAERRRWRSQPLPSGFPLAISQTAAHSLWHECMPPALWPILPEHHIHTVCW